MKYAFMTFSCPELTFPEVLELAQRYGYDGVEPRIDSSHGHGIERDAPKDKLAELRKMAEDAGVAICCIATSCKFADPDSCAQNVATALEAISLASSVGSPRLRVFGGQFPEAPGRERAKEQLCSCLLKIADHAQESGVIVCVETHDAWCNPEDLADVIARVDHPAIAINWDIMHPVRTAGFTIEKSFEVLKPWIRHVHFHDGLSTNGKCDLKPIGEGIIDHRAAVGLLQQAKYDGFLSGEWIRWEPCEVHLPRELKTIKSFESK